MILGNSNGKSNHGLKRKYTDINKNEVKHDRKNHCEKCLKNQLSLKYAGPYILGPVIEEGPLKCVSQYLARKMATDKFFSVKLLTLSPQINEKDRKNGKMLLHNEFTILSLLQDQDGVIHTHGFFEEEVEMAQNKSQCSNSYLGSKMKRNFTKTCKRYCLVLDCIYQHEYGPGTHDSINLQQYIVNQKKLNEKEAIVIFFDIVRVVKELHLKNVIHRDLKLGNIILNKSTKRITVTNFCLGKHLVRADELLCDQRGSPAYISPEVLCGQAYCGKGADNWALGVMLYTLLYAQFPFFDSSPRELFRKIKNVEYAIPIDKSISSETVLLVQGLLHPDASQRSTAAEIYQYLHGTVTSWYCFKAFTKDTQIVPFSPSINEKPKDGIDGARKMTSTFIEIPSPRVSKDKENVVTRVQGALTPINQVNRFHLNTTPVNLYNSPQTVRNRAGSFVHPLRDRETGHRLRNGFRSICPPISPI